MVNLLKRKLKMELTLAMFMTILLSSLVIYITNQSKYIERYSYEAFTSDLPKALQEAPSTQIQQIVKENIEGELRKGTFEIVVGDLRNLTYHYGGRIPYLNMKYENELWRGLLCCKLPTENVTFFTFNARKIINDHGKVTHIIITVTEIETSENGELEEQFSEVNISLREVAEGESPILNQVRTVISYLIIAFVWIAQGLIMGVPLCFALLGIVIFVNRGILPIWRKQLKSRNLSKSTA